MVSPRLVFTGMALMLLLAALPAAAHEPPDQRDFEIRLLTDQNDDCGGHGAGGCNGSHDLLALSLREAYFPAEGHVLVFALWMSPGTGTELRERITMDGPDGALVIEVTTSDGQTFAATDATRVEGPYPLILNGEPDGQRFGIDIIVKRDTWGLETGDRLSTFRVAAFIEGTPGDVMPGTYVVDGTMAEKGESEIGNPAETARPDYILVGPGRSLRLTAPEGPVEVLPGTSTEIEVTAENRLRDQGQEMVLLSNAPDGIAVRIEGGGAWSATLAPREARQVTLTLNAVESAEGEVVLHLMSEQGGLAEATLPITIMAPVPTNDQQDSPGLPLLPIALLLAALALVGRLQGR